AVGADVADADGPSRISRDEALRLPFDKGRILYPRQWYLGFRATLHRLEQQRAACPTHVRMNRPADIATMFDKPRCQELFARHDVPIPRFLGKICSFEELRDLTARIGCRR